MSRYVTVHVTVKLCIRMDEGVEVSDVINEMDSSFTAQSDGATIEDSEILEHEVTDSW